MTTIGITSGYEKLRPKALQEIITFSTKNFSQKTT
jgi:hypothetical protein